MKPSVPPFRYYVNDWIYGPQPFEATVRRIAAIGFDGIEVAGEPDRYLAEAMLPVLGDTGMAVVSICGIHPGPAPGDFRCLSHPAPRERERAVDYVRRCVDLAHALSARSVLVVPSMVGQTAPLVTKADDLARAAESLAQAGAHAESAGLLLTIEPINRYEVCLVNTMAEGRALATATGCAAVRTMGDAFHMQIEENATIPGAIRAIGPYWMQHFHAADNTREAPGRGALPWVPVMRALIDSGYEGGVSCELLPRGAMPYDVFRGGVSPEAMDRELAIALDTLRLSEAEARDCAEEATT